MALIDRLKSKGPKRILALNGGGIRGALTLGFLEEIERILRERHNDANFRLCDYFDLIGGTSTGAIIAGALAIGKTAGEVKAMYLELGGKVFSGNPIWKKHEALFDHTKLEEELVRLFEDRTLGDESIETGLCVVAKRADTRSTWPLLNHPDGTFYKHNEHVPLYKVIRASTAAPVFFMPQDLDVGKPGKPEIGAFVDGGVSMANNPDLQLFLVATLKGFKFCWETGRDNLLLVSVGTGVWEDKRKVRDVLDDKVWDWAKEVPAMLMEDASTQNQLILQYLSQSATAREIDSEVGDLRSDLLTPEPALTYLRYDVRLEEESLKALGLGELANKAKSLRKMSDANNRDDLAKIGEKGAAAQVKSEHFPAAFDINVSVR